MSQPRPTKRLRDTVEVMRREGFEYLGWTPAKGSHVKIKLRAPDGREFQYTTSAIGGGRDHARWASIRSDLRRMARTA